MGWFDEYFQEDTPADSGGSDAVADINVNLGDDLAEALGIAGIDIMQPWVSGITNTAAYAQRQGVGDAPRAESTKTPDPKEGQGLIGKISNFVDKNKSLSEILLKGVAGAAMGNQAKKSAEIAAQSRLDELKLKNQQEREKDAQVSASVSGLRAPAGLIGRPQQQLRRADGSLVYQNGRIA